MNGTRLCGVGGIVVSIAAFQAVDPGSIPGQRITFSASHLVASNVLGLFRTQVETKHFFSPSGNRTPVFRVTGGDTVHYTNEEAVSC